MSQIPVMPRLASYGGSKENLRQKIADKNAMAQRIADHLNTLIANDPREMQQYHWAEIARDLRLSADEIESAIKYGGHNGITVRVTDEDRPKLTRYLK